MPDPIALSSVSLLGIGIGWLIMLTLYAVFGRNK